MSAGRAVVLGLTIVVPHVLVAQSPSGAEQRLVVREQVEVVATRVAVAPYDLPAAMEVIDGETLRVNRRDPISESEVGDSQYYSDAHVQRLGQCGDQEIDAVARATPAAPAVLLPGFERLGLLVRVV